MTSLRAVLVVIALMTSPAVVLSSGAHEAAGETCPDQSECPDGDTCCELVSGDYGCCQIPDAVCCSDKQSCCPSGTTCNLQAGTCDKDPAWARHQLVATVGASQPLVKTSTISRAPRGFVPLEGQLAVAKVDSSAKVVWCPNRTTYCPDGNTCCLMPNHQWICCPLPSAACCPDGYHCCPYGQRCDPTSSHCYRDEDSVATWLKIVANKQHKTKL